LSARPCFFGHSDMGQSLGGASKQTGGEAALLWPQPLRLQPTLCTIIVAGANSSTAVVSQASARAGHSGG